MLGYAEIFKTIFSPQFTTLKTLKKMTMCKVGINMLGSLLLTIHKIKNMAINQLMQKNITLVT